MKNFQDYGSSEHVSSINSTLVKSEKNKKDLKLTKQRAIGIRDYLMVSLTYFNCLRASNLMNISLEDVKKIKKHEEVDDAYVLVNEEHKVSKIILLDTILLQQMKQYIELYRPLVSDNSKMTWRGMSSPLVDSLQRSP